MEYFEKLWLGFHKSETYDSGINWHTDIYFFLYYKKLSVKT